MALFGVTLGGLVGYEFLISKTTRMQIELTVSPLRFHPQGGFGITFDREFMFFFAQLGVGFNFGGGADLVVEPSGEL
ncbi:MAG: hypothetical protein H0U74_12955 [Bradymonadaceae bacterium]|nr:hypothetical protein [Lujinxingiaceae bacterium]